MNVAAMSSFVSVGLASTASEALADDSSQSSRIVGGELVKSCTWPATGILVSSEQTCTASLVHPEIVITAAHCTGKTEYIWFGDSLRMQTSKRFVVKECVNHPDFDEASNLLGQHTDLAYCTLERPVVGVPVTPILMGCELEVLQPGTPVYQVGFGDTSDTSVTTSGNKRQVLTTFNGFSEKHNGEALVGEPGKGPCTGDSGGPVYVKLPEEKYGADAGWRVFGVTSGGDGGCPGEARFGVMSTFVEFVEKNSGIDITPCTNADGTWNPGPNCKEAPLNPFAVSGNWVDGCAAAPVGGFIQSCGKPYDPAGDTGGSGGTEPKVDEEPPKTAIVTPNPNQIIPFGVPVDVRVSATDNVAIAEVELIVDGSSGGKRFVGPFRWRLDSLRSGRHTIKAKATDRAGNVQESEILVFSITAASSGEDGQGGAGPAGTTGGEAGQPEPGAGSTGGQGNNDDAVELPKGDGCKVGPEGGALWFSGAFALLLMVRRRQD